MGLLGSVGKMVLTEVAKEAAPVAKEYAKDLVYTDKGKLKAKPKKTAISAIKKAPIVSEKTKRNAIKAVKKHKI